MLKNVLAKCSTNKDQIRHKLDLGYNQFEVQLLTHTDYKGIDIFKEFPEMIILGVHTPIIDDEVLLLENIANDKVYTIFINTCMFAQHAANFYDRRIYVILHTNLSYVQYKMFKPLTDVIITIIKHVNYTFPDVDIVVENSSPVRKDNSLRNGTIVLDLFKSVNYLNSLSRASLFSVCVDTCHVMETNMLCQRIYKDNDAANEPTFKDPCMCWSSIFCKDSINLLHVIHLNNLLQNGKYELTHGAPFTNSAEDLAVLKEILSLYVKLDSFAFLTLEVREEDYLNIKNLPETYSNVVKTLTELNTEVLQEY